MTFTNVWKNNLGGVVKYPSDVTKTDAQIKTVSKHNKWLGIEILCWYLKHTLISRNILQTSSVKMEFILVVWRVLDRQIIK